MPGTQLLPRCDLDAHHSALMVRDCLEVASRGRTGSACFPVHLVEPNVPQHCCVSGIGRQLAARWNMPMELAIDLAALALYDIVIYADDSGSMAFEEGGERINDLKLIVGRTAEVLVAPHVTANAAGCTGASSLTHKTPVVQPLLSAPPCAL